MGSLMDIPTLFRIWMFALVFFLKFFYLSEYGCLILVALYFYL